jgi:hypothetical protein
MRAGANDWKEEYSNAAELPVRATAGHGLSLQGEAKFMNANSEDMLPAENQPEQ